MKKLGLLFITLLGVIIGTTYVKTPLEKLSFLYFYMMFTLIFITVHLFRKEIYEVWETFWPDYGRTSNVILKMRWQKRYRNTTTRDLRCHLDRLNRQGYISRALDSSSKQRREYIDKLIESRKTNTSETPVINIDRFFYQGLMSTTTHHYRKVAN